MQLTKDERQLIQDLTSIGPELPGFAIARGSMFMLDALLHDEIKDKETAAAIARAATYCLKDILDGRYPEDSDYHALFKLRLVFKEIHERLS